VDPDAVGPRPHRGRPGAYGAAPYPVVLYLKRLALQLPLPLILSAGVRRARAELRATEWIDAERLRSLADAKVRRLIAHVYASVPYYREVFDRERIDPREIRGVDDLPRLPMLTKAIVRERFADLRAHDFEAHTPVLGYTGGSTGQRSAHYVSRRCLDFCDAAVSRHYQAIGYHPGARCSVLYSPLEGALEQLLYYDDPWTRRRHLNTRLINRDRMRAMVEAMVGFRTEVIWAFPSHLEMLCQYIEETGDDRLQPRLVVTDAEVLYDYQRERVRRFLACDVFDWYGLAEQAAAAGECAQHRYHVPEEIVVLEVRTSDGAAAPGELGEIVGTSLENYAQPFIRYRTGDYASRSTDLCPCGRPHRTLDQIGGRTQDVITTPNGLTVLRHSLCDFSAPGVEAIQIEQLGLRRFLIHVMAPDGLSEDAARVLASKLRGVIDFEAAVEVARVSNIERTERGKRRLVISRVPFSFLG